jgi:hypothetical protein
MEPVHNVAEMRETVEHLIDLAQKLFASSEEFPAVNRNAKRVLAALEMMRIGLEEA